jgi:hypothetical protein
VEGFLPSLIVLLMAGSACLRTDIGGFPFLNLGRLDVERK